LMAVNLLQNYPIQFDWRNYMDDNRKKLLDIGLKFRGGAFPGETWGSLNTKHGAPFSSGEAWRSFVRRELKKQQQDEPVDKTEITINKDGTQTSSCLINMSKEQAKDVHFLLEAHGYCPKTWELVSARNNIWQTYSKLDKIQTLYSSKIVVKPRVDISFEEIKEHFEEFSNRYERPKIKKQAVVCDGKMLEIPIMDVHFSKLAWSGEVGESYDYKIAEQRLKHVIFDFIERTRSYKFEKIIFPVGQDFFHFDQIDGSTTKGTKMDADLRWQKLFLKGIEILIELIDLLSQIAPIEVFYVSGNHDRMTSYYATNYIYAWYRNDENVKVSVEPMARKYIEFGANLIGYSHGENERKRIAGIMQVEAKEAWGRTKFREWHLGHLHSEQTREENGIIIRKISSITGTDAWHYENGFIGAIRKAQAFIWDKECGLEAILNSAILP